MRLLVARGVTPQVLGPRAHAQHHEAMFGPLSVDRKREEVQALHLGPLADLVFQIAGRMRTTPEVRLMALELFLGTLRRSASARQMPGEVLVHDELLLRRGFTFLPLSDTPVEDARAYYALVPLPDAAVLCMAPPAVIAARFTGRAKAVLSYNPGDDVFTPRSLDRIVECCDAAAEVLEARGLRLHQLDLSGSPQDAAEALAAVLQAEVTRED